MTKMKHLLRKLAPGGVKKGEIKDDAFYDLIVACAARPDVRTLLEIGSSTGDGSTQAFVEGMAKNPERPTLFCVEALKDRFEVLRKRYEGQPSIKCYNVSSVGPEGIATEEEVRNFYRLTPTRLNEGPLETVLTWLRFDIDYVRTSGIPADGIRLIKRENHIEHFDCVLIDGSEFTGRAELDEVYGAKLLLLDDINALKNHYNCQRLLVDRNYRLIGGDVKLRGGYAAFEKV